MKKNFFLIRTAYHRHNRGDQIIIYLIDSCVFVYRDRGRGTYIMIASKTKIKQIFDLKKTRYTTYNPKLPFEYYYITVIEKIQN